MEGRVADSEQRIANLERDNSDIEDQLGMIARDMESLETILEEIRPYLALIQVQFGRPLQQINCVKCGRKIGRVGGKCMCGAVHGG